MRPILTQLPAECQGLTIAPRHKVLLTHQAIGGDMWVILLTDMPGDRDKAWRMTKRDYWNIQTLHESRDRWVRNRFEPTFQGSLNEVKKQEPLPTLF